MEVQKAPTNPVKPLIRYEDFVKMDIRIGTIAEVDEVPETDKLLKCVVDFGLIGKRTIVSGIKEFRSPDALVGTQALYIINLEPRVIKGIESQGMLLATSFEANSPSEGFAMLHPDIPVPPGVCIR
jgi:methionyl-tRNA synthetase